jgi:hypothetical protein
VQEDELMHSKAQHSTAQHNTQVDGDVHPSCAGWQPSQQACMLCCAVLCSASGTLDALKNARNILADKHRDAGTVAFQQPTQSTTIRPSHACNENMLYCACCPGRLSLAHPVAPSLHSKRQHTLLCAVDQAQLLSSLL